MKICLISFCILFQRIATSNSENEESSSGEYGKVAEEKILSKIIQPESNNHTIKVNQNQEIPDFYNAKKFDFSFNNHVSHPKDQEIIMNFDKKNEDGQNRPLRFYFDLRFLFANLNELSENMKQLYTQSVK